MRPGELVVATGKSDVLHIAHAYRAGAIFTLCGLHDGLDIVEGDVEVDCRRCRVGGAEALRENLRNLADMQSNIDTTEDRIAYLRAALGGGDAA